MQELILNFLENDRSRIKTHLNKLLKHIKKEDLILAGGIAIRHYAYTHGIGYPSRETNDLDFLLTSPNSMHTSITKDFMLSHYHINRSNERDRFYYVVVDPETKIKSDLFDEKPLPSHPKKVSFEEKTLNIRSPEDQFVTKIIEISQVLENQVIPDKWFRDIKMMEKFIEFDLTETYWKELINTPFFKDNKLLHRFDNLKNTWTAIQEQTIKTPSLLQKDTKHKDKPYTCDHCLISKEFPITPMEKIYDILGYYV